MIEICSYIDTCKMGDIIAVAHGFQVMHFNGLDWHNFGPELNQINSFTWSVFLFDNTIFLVGNEGQTKAYIFIGRR
ncbi:MAG: hypothetical protein H6627_10725 [Calditrichae bacterium]|nr:hypothetical protein [Calditrichia bacterium]